MINELILKDILVRYKRDLATERWDGVKYKLEAVKWFQDNWDIDAPDFADMLNRSLDKASDLLDYKDEKPKTMIVGFAKAAPEEVRAMFVALYDERGREYGGRDRYRGGYKWLYRFIKKSVNLNENYGNGAAWHYQDNNAVSIYLWLRYPDKIYIFNEYAINSVEKKLEFSFPFLDDQCDGFPKDWQSFMQLYDEVNAAIKKDTQLVNLFRSLLTNECYLDPELKTLTSDVCSYISENHINGNNSQEEACIAEEEDPAAPEDSIAPYGKDDFLNEVYMDPECYESLVGVLRNKKNIILQGAPGVGKTFTAKRLAWSMMGEMDDSRIEFVQFHQNYSYEDFMMGYKPVEDGFKLKYGIFYRFCQKAANQPDKEFFFIIDEINRGNMSKIFGELLMLIEKDYRGTKATLAYNGLSFSVPKNLYIIGMMNTADRSLAMIDYALRRRFSFFEVEPGFDSEGFIRYQKKLDNETLNELIERVKELNLEISQDKSLGKGFCIGHSYFCGREEYTEEWLRLVVNYDILPMLREYWFDDANKLQYWENILQGVVKNDKV